ncbi:hypothetical protein [Gemmobacter sp. LW-1]|uniref:hypothetical protein n=1 Tax=Gemmobacter sp. LW-1 TaxID=1529005 RepID=UPI0006C741DE|nr:hypothetical protein [Gemmobacter sp. LW-1]
MSRFLASRIARLEAKRKANEPPPRLIGYSLDGTPMWNVEEGADGVLRFVPRFTNEQFAARCALQQRDLMNRLAAYEAELSESEEGTSNEKHTSPNETGEVPLKPGQKRARYLFTVENGVETQLDRLTGERIQIGKV